MNLKNLDKKLLKRMELIIGIILLAFIIIIFVKILAGNRISYTKIEDKMMTAAKEYYQENTNELPISEGGTTKIDINKLIELKYLKDLKKLTKDKKAICNGEVKVTNNNNHYLYSASLDCGEYYKTRKLTDILTSQIVSSGDGLYQVGDYYLFRGEYVNNYVEFADKTWLILRVNSDGSIRMIETSKLENVVWDDRYNSDKQSNVGINDFNVSRIKDTLEYRYSEFNESSRAYLFNQNLCIGKRNEVDTINDGSIECSKILENQSLGLLQVNEFALASIDSKCRNVTDPECTNYNYLTQLDSYWTLTADSENSHKVFKISGTPFVSNASGSSRPRLVIHITPDVNYVSGDGSYYSPYKFK